MYSVASFFFFLIKIKVGICRTNSTECRIFPEGYVPKFLVSKTYQFVTLRTQLVRRSNGRKLWIWRVGVGYRQGFWHSWENGGFWQQERAFLHLWTKPQFTFRGTGREKEFLVPHQQNKQGVKPLCSMHVKTFSSEIRSMPWQSVSFITNTLFRKTRPFRLPNYCFKLSSYTREEDNARLICT